jgi:hypothetical protein
MRRGLEKVGEFRDSELSLVYLQRLKMDSAWERSSLDEDIRCDIRGSKGAELVSCNAAIWACWSKVALSSLCLSLSLSQEGTEESMETLTVSTSILEGEVSDLANSFATLSSLSTTTQSSQQSIGGDG